MLLLISQSMRTVQGGNDHVSVCICVCPSCHRSVVGRGSESAGHSVCSGWCQQTVPVNSDSISAGICGNWREREEGGAAGARGDTGRIVPLSDSPFSLISSRSSYRKPDRKKKICRFLLLLSLQFLFLAPPPLSFSIHSSFYWKPFLRYWSNVSSWDINGNRLLGL